MIAGMAHPTLKSGAATRNSVAFRYQLKIHVNGRTAEDRSPVLPQIGSGRCRPGSRPAADGLMGRLVIDNGPHAQMHRTRTFEPSVIPF
jgi:hypothetical protein